LIEKWFSGEFGRYSYSSRIDGETEKVMKLTSIRPWTGDIVDRSYFTDKRYEKYRQPGNIKIPFWLKPVKYYKGPAWYQKNC